MRNNLKFRFAGIGIMLAMCAFFGVAVMLLWNALMPQIFGLMPLSYLQATGLLVLARALFGGFGGGWHGRHHGHHGDRLREKFISMSDEERREFFARRNQNEQ
jgi:hypothetical protein